MGEWDRVALRVGGTEELELVASVFMFVLGVAGNRQSTEQCTSDEDLNGAHWSETSSRGVIGRTSDEWRGPGGCISEFDGWKNNVEKSVHMTPDEFRRYA